MLQRSRVASLEREWGAQSFQSGQTFASAQVALLGTSFAVLRTYTLVNASVVAYRQTGDAGTAAFVQELVLRSKSLTIG